MILTTLLTIYFVGYIIAYRMSKRIKFPDSKEYTKGERRTVLKMASLSWLIVIVVLIIKIEDRNNKTKDEPAKW